MDDNNKKPKALATLLGSGQHQQNAQSTPKPAQAEKFSPVDLADDTHPHLPMPPGCVVCPENEIASIGTIVWKDARKTTFRLGLCQAHTNAWRAGGALQAEVHEKIGAEFQRTLIAQWLCELRADVQKAAP